MSQPSALAKVRITEVAIIAAIPSFSYLLLWFYYQPQFEHYNVPIGLFRPNSMQALLFGASIAIFFVLTYVIGQLVAKFIPGRHPLLIRLRRFVGIMFVPEFLFGTIALLVSSGEVSPLQYFLIIHLLLAPIIIYLLMGDFILPLIRHRKLKGLRAKFGQESDLEVYRTPTAYFIDKVRVVLPVLAILIIAVAYAMGTRATRGLRSYMIINSDPQQIVLINFGDKMLTAEVRRQDETRRIVDRIGTGDSYAATEITTKYVYRPRFKIIDVNDLNKDTFAYLILDEGQLEREDLGDDIIRFTTRDPVPAED
ncbi:MAG TPA: hypothetical protein VK694_05005 [Verrucomicrobiae bacterium]|nr:hypothetical protein [Verrucomicrobiae bacterium]